MILVSPVIGVLLPGPFGLPLFLIGFALVTFPGKRRITARILHGRPLPLSRRLVSWGTATLAVILPALLFWYIAQQEIVFVQHLLEVPLRWIIPAGVASYLIVMIVIWFLSRLILGITNRILRLIPLARRRIRPWLRKRGIMVLPPRRANRNATDAQMDQDILELSPRQQQRVHRVWRLTKIWGRRSIGIVIAAAIFFWMAKPIIRDWPHIRPYIHEINPGRFILAAVMFSVFLFVFRAVVWRLILTGFGHALPSAASLRIWCTSELARYIPGSIMQVIGRAILAKPYGVSGTICSTSQILELATFLLANIIVAVGCLLWFATKLEPTARPWLIVAICLLPTLGVLLHPKIFYTLTNAVCTRLGKPPIVQRLSGSKLFFMLVWSVVGLLFQSLAIWLLIGQSLHIPIGWWWRIAGAYCLAWTAGFLAVTNPGGLGVREIVFYYALRAILPASLKNLFPSREILNTYLLFLGILLRLWTIAGELMLTAIAYIFDIRGALNQPDAPGQVQ